MQFSISSAELSSQLQLIGGVINSGGVLPILEDFHFTIKDNVLTARSTDLETSLTTRLAVAADGDADIAVPAKILIDTLKALPEQLLNFHISEDGRYMQIVSAYGKYKIMIESGEDFPRLPEIDDVDEIELPARILQKGVAKTIFATSSDELRPAMTGVLFEIEQDEIRFVATDAHRLVRYSFSNINSAINASFIVPKRALTQLKNILPEGDETVKLSFNKQFVFFTTSRQSLACRLIDARYPDYTLVIPKENPNTLEISGIDFFRSAKRIAIYASRSNNQIVVNMNESALTVFAQDMEIANEAEETLTCNFVGTPMKIGFNAKFLSEMLGALDDNEVKMEFSTPSRAGLLFPAEPKANESLLMLIMPVMLAQ